MGENSLCDLSKCNMCLGEKSLGDLSYASMLKMSMAVDEVAFLCG